MKYPLRHFLFLYILAGLSFLSCSQEPDQPEPELPEISAKVMSYNIHTAIGTDGVLSINRIIGILKNSGADIIALTEVDRNYDSRSDYQDQLQIIADALDMEFVFQKTTWKKAIPESGNKPREFGHAILTRYPIRQILSEIYDAHGVHYGGLLGTEITLEDQQIRVFLTHLDTDAVVRSSQVSQAVEWIGPDNQPTLLMGDMNAEPEDASIRDLMTGRTDAFEDQPDAFTFKANNPSIRIDYILGSGPLSFSSSRVIATLASDHLPIVTDITLE